jgi:hypothetical protein
MNKVKTSRDRTEPKETTSNLFNGTKPNQNESQEAISQWMDLNRN